VGALLVIVRRENLARYEQFNRGLAGQRLEVIIDRRRGERRQRQDPRAAERRRGDRRAQIRGEMAVPIDGDIDVVSARHKGRELATTARLSATDAALVATAVSSLARNIVSHVRRGTLVLRVIENRDTQGIEVVAVSSGPDKPGAGQILEAGDPTPGRLHQWLGGIQHLVDEFHVRCELAPGTPIAIRRWRR